MLRPASAHEFGTVNFPSFGRKVSFDKTAEIDSRNCWFRCLFLTNKKQPDMQTPTAVEVKKSTAKRKRLTGRLKDLADVDESEKQKKKKS